MGIIRGKPRTKCANGDCRRFSIRNSKYCVGCRDMILKKVEEDPDTTKPVPLRPRPHQ